MNTLISGLTEAAGSKLLTSLFSAQENIAIVHMHLVDPESIPATDARKAAYDALDATREGHRTLLQAGYRAEGVPAPKEIPLNRLDTADARDLLELLQRAQEIAERVDASRGRALPTTIPLQPGESYGTDLAESISYLVLRLNAEVNPPKGRD